MERSPIPTNLMGQESRLTQLFYYNMKDLHERRKKEKESKSQMKFFIKAKPSTDEPDPMYACIAADDCSICCERDVVTNMFRTPCGHHFHRSCLQRWCDHNNSCPNCREPNPFNKTQRKIDFEGQLQHRTSTQTGDISNNYFSNNYYNNYYNPNTPPIQNTYYSPNNYYNENNYSIDQINYINNNIINDLI